MKKDDEPTLLIRAIAAAEKVAAQPRAGRPEAEAVIAVARSQGDHEALTVAARAAAWAAREVYEHAEANALIEDALRAARADRLDERISEALVTRSAIRLEEGRTGAARNDLVEARRHASTTSLPDVAFAEALLEEHAGNYEAASKAYAEVVDLSPERKDIRAKAYNNWAQVLRALGDFATAELLLEAAAEDAATFSPALGAIVAHNMAGVVAEAGRPAEAIRRYDEAAEALEAAGLPLQEHYLDKTQTLLGLRLLPEARESIDRAVAALDIPGGSLLLADALVVQARIARSQDQPDEAMEAARRAAALLRSQRRWGWRAAASLVELQAQWESAAIGDESLRRLQRVEASLRRYGDLFGAVSASLLAGRVASAHGRQRTAGAAFARAHEAAMRGPMLLRLEGRLAAALGAELDGDRQRVAQICRGALDELERFKASLGSSELRARAAAHGAELSSVGLRSALRGGRALSVWSWLERARTVTFAGHGQPEIDDEMAPKLAELRGLETDLATPFDDLEARSSVLRRISTLESQIRTTAWKRERPTASESLELTRAPSQYQLNDLRNALDDRTLLQYGEVDGAVVAVTVSQRGIRVHELGSAAELAAVRDNLGFALHRLSRPRSAASVVAARASADESLRRLSELLIAPLSAAASPGPEVVVVPPSNLIGVPWGALPHLSDRIVCVVPSAVAWKATSDAVAPTDRIAIAAGPGLESAPREAEAIAGLYANPTLLMPEEAESAGVLDAASGAATVHLACHGRLRSDSPTFSGFQLSDGPLTVHDLEQLEVPAHRWILAACDLGRVGSLSGPDLEGVLAALFGRGAAAVVAAVTPIPDETAIDLMVPLHESLASGLRASEALALARHRLDDAEPLGFVTKVAFACYGAG